MAIEFRLAPHNINTSVNIVEILVDGMVCGVIYPEEPKGIKVVSAHIKETTTENDFTGQVIEDNGSTSWPPIPSVSIRFEPSPYFISGGKIVRLPRQ